MSYDSTLSELEFFSEQQIAEAKKLPVIVTLVGPIRYWWGARWNSEHHQTYVAYRDKMRLALATTPGVVVYSPHRAIQGAWHPALQLINDTAIRMSDALVDLTPDWLFDITADGTAEELRIAKSLKIPVVWSRCYLKTDFVVQQVLTAVKR